MFIEGFDLSPGSLDPCRLESGRTNPSLLWSVPHGPTFRDLETRVKDVSFPKSTSGKEMNGKCLRGRDSRYLKEV